ncbi:hypothetical protein [Streptomyces sp. NPDC006134]|uniref:hypothetical protein n=1 Tax=Streptomyces sp. NPDC006134 TaxID=3154467 RepID=UPI0033F9121A
MSENPLSWIVGPRWVPVRIRHDGRSYESEAWISAEERTTPELLGEYEMRDYVRNVETGFRIGADAESRKPITLTVSDGSGSALAYLRAVPSSFGSYYVWEHNGQPVRR